ncbi:DUF3048 domain-containing protein [Candidatus Saccharibacteria bacterium]|nr:DUF3048 domain-containing protein [Candidatus Saccharibacteria bacterium]
MSGKQAYFGKVKPIDTKKQKKTLADIYGDNTNDDVEEFINNNSADVDEETPKEKKSAKIKREKSERRAEKGRKAGRVIKRIIILLIIAAAAGAGVWFFLQSQSTQQDMGAVEGAATEADKIYYSRLTGNELNSEELANRPATCIMIENSPAARPQSGLKDAGIVIESLAEGGISRFMGIFQESQPQYIGPVRSVRMAYVELAKPYHCSIAHAGGATNAVNLIRNNSGFRDIDQFFNDSTYRRIRSRGSPHNLYTSFEKIDALNYKKGYRSSEFKGFARTPVNAEPETPEKVATKIKITMSGPLYNPVYTYDKNTNKYLRAHESGGPHYDIMESGVKTQHAPDVVIAMKVTAYTRATESKYSDYTTTGIGDAYIFQNGGVISARWERKDADSELRFVDTSGNDIQLNRGQTWISLYPSTGKVTWE